MATLLLKLSLKIEDAQKREESLQNLKKWLENSGVQVEWPPEPPVEEELGKVTTGLLIVCLLNEGMHGALEPIHNWQARYQDTPVVLHLTGNPELDEEIQKVVREQQYHLEIEKPENPPKEKERPGASPPPNPPTPSGINFKVK